MAYVRVLCVGGTGESYAGDMRREVTGALSQSVSPLVDPVYFEPQWVGYHSAYGNTSSYRDSVQNGILSLYYRIIELQALDGAANPTVLFGYSQGATVVSEFTEMVANGDVDVPLFGALTLGSPVHNPMNSVPGTPKTRSGAYGVSGRGMSLQENEDGKPMVIDMVAPGDPIAEMMPGALLRDVADMTEFMSLSSPKEWADDVRRKIRTQGFQNAVRRGITQAEAIQLLGEAGADLRRYLPWHPALNPEGGRHTAYTSELAVVRGVKRNFTWAEGLGHYLNKFVGVEGEDIW